MRLAIVSDIHGNLTALEAVIADIQSLGVDLVVQGGDLAMGGHRPGEVIDRIRDLGWPGVVGNTDEVLWTPEKFTETAERAPKIRPLLEVLFKDFAVTRVLIGDERLAWLQALPREWHGEAVAVVHASPGDLWQAPMPDCESQELAWTYCALNASIAVYGHIHRPYVRELPGLIVANSGSVGQPYDGDPRASYLLIEDGTATVRRVEYDVESEIKELLASGYPHAGWLAQIRRQARYLPPF